MLIGLNKISISLAQSIIKPNDQMLSVIYNSDFHHCIKHTKTITTTTITKEKCEHFNRFF